MFVPFIVDEGDTISLENLKKIGDNTSSHMLLSAVDSRRHELPWISLEAQLPTSNVSFPWAKNLKIC